MPLERPIVLLCREMYLQASSVAFPLRVPG